MQNHSGYFRNAFKMMVASPGWFANIIKLLLLNFIPIFGPIMFWAYAGRWCKQLANGYNVPMPEHVFENHDGMLFRDGLYGWGVWTILTFLASIVASLITSLFVFIPYLGDIVTILLSVALYLLVPAIAALALQAIFLGDFGFGFKFAQLFRAIKADVKAYFKCAVPSFIAMVVVALIGIAVFALFMAIAVRTGWIDLSTLQGYYDLASDTINDTASVDSSAYAALGDYVNAHMGTFANLMYLLILTGVVAVFFGIGAAICILVATTEWMVAYLNPSSPLQRTYFTGQPHDVMTPPSMDSRRN